MIETGSFHCPQCKNDIPEERWIDSVIVCPHCGWLKSDSNQKQQKQMHSKFRRTILGLSIVFVVTFIHSVNWERHFYSIIPLKIKQISGQASSEELNQLANICMDRKKPECAIEALNQASKIDGKNLELLSRLGDLQFRAKKFAQAEPTFESYFSQGGLGINEAFQYAQVLEELKKPEEAKKYYEMVLASKPNVMQITVTQKYVRFLVRLGELKKAKRTIERIRRKGTNTAYFLEREMKVIRKKLKDQRGS